MVDFNMPDLEWIPNNTDRALHPSQPTNEIHKLPTNTLTLMKLYQYNSCLNGNGRILDLLLCNIPCKCVRSLVELSRSGPHHPPIEFDMERSAQKTIPSKYVSV